MARKSKGMGSTTNHSITLPQRFALMKWCESRRDDTSTYLALSEQASEDLGFVVTPNVMQSHWVSVNGQRYRKEAKDDSARIRDLAARLSAVERKLDGLALFVGGCKDA